MVSVNIDIGTDFRTGNIYLELNVVKFVFTFVSIIFVTILLLITISSFIIWFNYNDIITYLNGISFKYRKFLIKVEKTKKFYN